VTLQLPTDDGAVAGQLGDHRAEGEVDGEQPTVGSTSRRPVPVIS
jgi:hypothetical protein